MMSFGRKGISMILAVFSTFILLSHSVDSSVEHPNSVQSHRIRQSSFPKILQLKPELSFQITLHALLLWASIGFLMPVGILVIRMSQRVECSKRLKILFYSHVVLQVISVLLATAGAILSLIFFENSFSNTHQRLGLALYVLIWVQPLIGFCRPHRGVKVRSIWYYVHWLLGTGISLIGIINIYIGLYAYHVKTSTSVRIWNISFTVEVVIIAFIYLFQDRWDYIKKQGVILGNEQITPTDLKTSPRRINQKQLGVMLQMVGEIPRSSLG